jgi:hypothetical protein
MCRTPVGPRLAGHGSVSPMVGRYFPRRGITRLVEAMFLVAFGIAVARDRVLPQWTTSSAYPLAAINLAFVPSIYFGNDPANFYAAKRMGDHRHHGGTDGAGPITSTEIGPDGQRRREARVRIPDAFPLIFTSARMATCKRTAA